MIFELTTGTVKWFNDSKGFGFIVPTGTENQDVFVHHSAIKAEDGEYRSLNEGDEVEFEIAEGKKGPEAKDVLVTKKAPEGARRERSDRQQPRDRPNNNRSRGPSRVEYSHDDRDSGVRSHGGNGGRKFFT